MVGVKVIPKVQLCPGAKSKLAPVGQVVAALQENTELGNTIELTMAVSPEEEFSKVIVWVADVPMVTTPKKTVEAGAPFTR